MKLCSSYISGIFFEPTINWPINNSMPYLKGDLLLIYNFIRAKRFIVTNDDNQQIRKLGKTNNELSMHSSSTLDSMNFLIDIRNMNSVRGNHIHMTSKKKNTA